VDKPRKIRWAGHAAQKKSAYVIIVAKPERERLLGKVCISGKLILGLVLNKQDRRTLTGSIQLTIRGYWERDNGVHPAHNKSEERRGE
jgi:hypothetical protein